MEAEGGWRRTGTQQREVEAQEEEQGAAVEPEGKEQLRDEEDQEKEEILQGIASIALFPSGSLSGHFVHTASSTCLGLFGTEIACERECSRGEDYRLMNLTIINFKTKKETTVVVERKGEDAARLSTTCDLHGWDEEVVVKANERHRSGEASPVISFECETLKADIEAEEHVQKFLPSLVGRDAVVMLNVATREGIGERGVVTQAHKMPRAENNKMECAVNIGRMTIRGLSLAKKGTSGDSQVQAQVARGVPKRNLEDTLRLVFGDVDRAAPGLLSPAGASASAPNGHVTSHPHELQRFISSTPMQRLPCDFDDDF